MDAFLVADSGYFGTEFGVSVSLLDFDFVNVAKLIVREALYAPLAS